MSDKPIIYVLKNHHELLHLWRELGFKQIKVLHLDAHCDMHGSLVNRKNNSVYILPDLKIVDCGNFISFAIQDGIIDSVKWMHDEHGGRDKDLTHVKYNTDLSSFFYLVKNYFSPFKKYYLNYDELLFNGNFVIEEDEHLDIDWDFFALKDKSKEEMHKSIYSFLSANFIGMPRYTYISYSGNYVSDTKEEFNDFIFQLKDRFKAEIINYSYPLTYEEKPKNLLTRCELAVNWRLRRYLFFPFKRQLNKIGIY